MAARKKVAVKKGQKKLYRFYVAGPDGEDATTLAIVSAANDSEAYDLGFKQYPSQVMEAFSAEYGVSDDDDSPFYSVESLADRLSQQGDDVEDHVSDMEYILGSIPALVGSSDQLVRHLAYSLLEIVSQEK